MQQENLYEGLITQHVEWPRCYGGLTRIARIVEFNFMDKSTTSNAITRFLQDADVNTLYICGAETEHAEPFFEDLRKILHDEVIFVHLDEFYNDDNKKRIVRVTNRNPYLVTEVDEHVGLKLLRTEIDMYESFDRKDLASFVYAINLYGYDKRFECQNYAGLQCLQREFSGSRECGVCFRFCPLLNANLDLDPDDAIEIDEGVVAEPLGVPRRILTKYLRRPMFF